MKATGQFYPYKYSGIKDEASLPDDAIVKMRLHEAIYF
jgi:hypothetical protein